MFQTISNLTAKIILGITLKSEELSGSKSLVLKATLSGGKGDVGWQHAQLFRTKVDEHQSDYQFKLIVKLKQNIFGNQCK